MQPSSAWTREQMRPLDNKEGASHVRHSKFGRGNVLRTASWAKSGVPKPSQHERRQIALFRIFVADDIGAFDDIIVSGIR